MASGRSKVQAAFSPAGAPEIPAVIPYEGIFIRDHWRELTACPWWYAESPDLAHQLAWRRDVITAIGQDWCEAPSTFARDERDHLVIEERGGELFRVDRRTAEEEHLRPPVVSGWGADGLAPVRPEYLPVTRDEIDRAIPLDLEPDLTRLRSGGSADLAISLFEGHARDLCPIRSVGAPLWETYYVWGFEGMMTMVAHRPDLVEYACQRNLQRAFRSIRRSAALGARVIWIEDCMTDMISPRAYAALNLPFLRQVVAAVRAAGMWSIHYFCGNPAGKWDHLLATGADALSVEESKKGFVIDIEEVVARAGGRCTVLGNLDAVGMLQGGSDEELRAEIARQVAAGRRNGGRFIMSLGSPVTPQTPMARVRLYCNLAHELGKE